MSYAYYWQPQMNIGANVPVVKRIVFVVDGSAAVIVTYMKSNLSLL